MLTNHSNAKTKPHPKQKHVDPNEQNEHHVHDHVLIEHNLTEEEDLVEAENADVRQTFDQPNVTNVLQTIDAVDQEDSQTRSEDVDRDPADDLIGAELDRDHCV